MIKIVDTSAEEFGKELENEGASDSPVMAGIRNRYLRDKSESLYVEALQDSTLEVKLESMGQKDLEALYMKREEALVKVLQKNETIYVISKYLDSLSAALGELMRRRGEQNEFQIKYAQTKLQDSAGKNCFSGPNKHIKKIGGLAYRDMGKEKEVTSRQPRRHGVRTRMVDGLLYRVTDDEK